jgi:general L-amino acid transport system substrate-binding protein
MSHLRQIFRAACIAAALIALCVTPWRADANTLSDVQKRGVLNCGVNPGLAGFAVKAETGEWSGFDVDFCKAIAAAILQDATKVNYVPLSASARFDALRGGAIDVLIRNSTWTLEREGALGLLFAGINYHDGQSFLVARKPDVTSALELDNAKICVQADTTTRRNLSDYFRANSMQYQEIVVQDPSEATLFIADRKCDVFTADQSALYAERLNLKAVKDLVVVPDVISKEPLGPVTRADDISWFNIVKWVTFALINAEELGISQTALDAAMKSTRPDVQRFLGRGDGAPERILGLDRSWALNAVRAVGNYGEIFARNVGVNSKLAIPRGLNQLWSTGGILYAPPMQ